ncbi:MAG: hypothetical protein OXI75_16320 [Rhodospirillales bacterium]|nr:hypothetical protein [Rhodospirillales bacterium]
MSKISRHANLFIGPGRDHSAQAKPVATLRRRTIERDKATP